MILDRINLTVFWTRQPPRNGTGDNNVGGRPYCVPLFAMQDG